MPSTLSPIRPATTLPYRVPSEMKPYKVSFIARPPDQVARPVTLTIWALGMSTAILLAQRQIADARLAVLSSMSCKPV